MKDAVEMGSGAMIYIPGFVKIASGIQKLIGGGDSQRADLIRLLLFFLNKARRLVNGHAVREENHKGRKNEEKLK
jgi:hypothetical protein